MRRDGSLSLELRGILGISRMCLAIWSGLRCGTIINVEHGRCQYDEDSAAILGSMLEDSKSLSKIELENFKSGLRLIYTNYRSYADYFGFIQLFDQVKGMEDIQLTVETVDLEFCMNLDPTKGIL